VFPTGGIRSRGVRLDTWRMADGKHDYAFVHMTLKVGHGRDLATRQKVAQYSSTLLPGTSPTFRLSACWRLSFEMIELHEQLNFKENNVHAFLKAQAR
jgi:5-carboxymethyl-2-hydroxymuconate isomerase